jgi:hypothetical protein
LRTLRPWAKNDPKPRASESLCRNR